MTFYLMAQVIGFFGYILYVRASHLKIQHKAIHADAVACAILCFQWMLLGHPILVTLNILVVLTSIVALNLERIAPIYTKIFYICGIGALSAFYQGQWVDVFTILSFSCVFISRTSKTDTDFRVFGVLGAASLTCCGMLALSIPAIIFNSLCTLGHFKHLKTTEHQSATLQFLTSQTRKKLIP